MQLGDRMAYETHTNPFKHIDRQRLLKTSMVITALLTLVGVVVQIDVLDAMTQITNPEHLSDIIMDTGPIAVVVLLALAVVVSPIPSGPVAMAAGAMFGTMEGGAFTALGAVLGSFIAFTLARTLGYRPLSASNLAIANWITRPRPELKLALIILISRLIPFISFDAVSYVAGLSSIRPRNFVLATTIGVLPASFAFAALGAGIATMDNAAIMIAACGITVILPLGWAATKALRSRKI